MKLKVTFLDCKSHGDCSVIIFKENGDIACIVIDGGENKSSAKALEDFLQNEGIKKINLLIGTHIDADHINGLKYFVRTQADNREKEKDFIDIEEYWGAMPSRNFGVSFLPHFSVKTDDADYEFSWQDFVIQSVQQNDDLIVELKRLDTKIYYPALDNPVNNPFNNIDIKLFNPDTQIPSDSISKKALGVVEDIGLINDEIDLSELEDLIEGHHEKMSEEAKRNANNQSIVVKISLSTGIEKARYFSFLFTGDAEEEAWEEILNNDQIADDLSSKVLKIPHHGSSQNGITKKGIEKVSPHYSLNLAGQKHGLPDEKLLKEISKAGSSIYCPIRNQSSKKKSACYSISGNECPAKNNSSNIEFIVDSKTGDCIIHPKNRECSHNWNNN